MNTETTTKETLLHRAWNWLTDWVKRHKIISFLVLLYLLSKAITTPIVNPFASDVYTIRGRFPFDKGFSLSFNQSPYGDALWLRKLCGWPVATQGVCTGGSNWIEPTRIGKDHYELKIYRDRFFAGPGNWKESTSSLAYVNSVVSDLSKTLGTRYSNDGSSVCDDSDTTLSERKVRLFCTNQLTHKDFKHLHLPDGQPVQANERLINFWLDSELTPMLETHQPGAQP